MKVPYFFLNGEREWVAEIDFVSAPDKYFELVDDYLKKQYTGKKPKTQIDDNCFSITLNYTKAKEYKPSGYRQILQERTFAHARLVERDKWFRGGV